MASNGDHCRMIIQNGRQSIGILINGIKMALSKISTERCVRLPELQQERNQMSQLQSLIANQSNPQRKHKVMALMLGKKTKGRKRHLLVDTMGLLIEVLVHTEGIQDRDGGRFLVSKAKTNGATFYKGYTDGGYTGKFLDWTKGTWDVDFEVVKRNELHKFVVLPKRWIVERTNSWIIRYRRLAKDFERYSRTMRNWIFLAMTRLMLRRLAKYYG